MYVLEQFQPEELLIQMEYLLRIFSSGMLGLMIGIERKNRNKSAGVRTHAIIALGAALMMVVSKYGFLDTAGADASRVAAQVVSGIGFLGAGVIFIRNNLVSGLTTAAGMWVTAGVGMAMGAGMYVVGIASAILIMFMQMVTHRIAYFSNVASGGYIRMTIAQEPDAVLKMENFLKNAKVSVVSLKIAKNKKNEIKLEFDVVYPPGMDKDRLRAQIAELENVISISE